MQDKNTIEILSIENANKLKINKIGIEMASLGFFFILIFGIVLIPGKYLPIEVATVYYFEIISKNIYIILSVSFLIGLTGLILKESRSYEPAELEILYDRLKITTKEKIIEIKYSEIEKFKGKLPFPFIKKENIIIKRIEKKNIEIRTEEGVFEALTNIFPDKI